MTTQQVSVGIHVPSASVAPLDAGTAYSEFFRHVESLGLDAVWTEDRLFHSVNMLDPLMLLAWAAMNTQRIQLGTSAGAQPAPRSRSGTADFYLQHLAGGRLALAFPWGDAPTSTRVSAYP